MSKVRMVQCGGERKEACINVETNDFAIEIGDKQFRFGVDASGNITILLINGVDMKIISERGYAGVKLVQRT